MRTIQNIFDVVIDNGYYCSDNETGGSSYMCGSLSLAYHHGVINGTELLVAKEHIKHFLSSLGASKFLAVAVLNSLGLDYTCDKDRSIVFNKCLEIYLN